MRTVRYFVDIPDELKHHTKSFEKWLNYVLSPDRKYGITAQTGVRYRQTYQASHADIVVGLVYQADISKQCGFEKLSCSLMHYSSVVPDRIMFSFENWMGDSKFEGSLRAYRIYLINHEFLHCKPFYLDHPNPQKLKQLCKNNVKLPVMYQQSRGTVGKCRHNSWPLPAEFKK